MTRTTVVKIQEIRIFQFFWKRNLWWQLDFRTFHSNSPDSDSKSLDVLCIYSNFHSTKGVFALLQGRGVHMIYIYIWLALQQKIIWPHLSTTKLIRPYLYTLHRDLRVISPFHGSYCRLLDEAIAAMVAIARSSQRAGRICPPWIQRDAEPGLSGAIYHLQRAQWR